MNKVTTLYSQIIDDSKSKHGVYQRIVRTTHTQIPTVYAISMPESMRKFAILWNEKLSCRINQFPRWNGLNLDLVDLKPSPEIEGRYLVFEQLPGSASEIFELIIDDLASSLDKITDVGSLSGTVLKILKKWQAFFKISPSGVLSDIQIQGLYGELLFLRYLIKNIGSRAVSCWTGPNAETHDYYLNGNAFEIKTSSKKIDSITISSEMQLDDSEVVNSLYLVYYKLRKSEAEGETLPEIISEIREQLNDSPLVEEDFLSRLFNLGYIVDYDNKYTTRFMVREKTVYTVEDNFPRITRKSLPCGVSSITYVINLDVCNDFVLSCEEFIGKLT